MMTVMVRRSVCLPLLLFLLSGQAGLPAGFLALALLGGHGGSG